MSVTLPSTTSSVDGPSFSTPELRAAIMRFRVVHPLLNLAYLAWEYTCLVAVIGGTIFFCESRESWGLAWAWNVPVVALAVVLIGAIQHRLAGLGHESSHYTFVRNKTWNDLFGDLFCMFPILSTIHYYRVFHMAHHQYTNDPEHDPDLVNLGRSKMVDRFPMPRWAFIKAFYLRAFTEPWEFVRYQLEYVNINVIGRAENVYLERSTVGRRWPRLAITLGAIYLAAFIAGQWAITRWASPGWLYVEGVVGTLLVLAVGFALPKSAFFPSPFRQPYSPRLSGMMRLVYLSAILVALGVLRVATHGHSSIYFYLLWVLPITSTFPFFMLLRDIYQHTNADDGRLTNTRVFYPDVFTRWAVFVYGQDMHVPHHLFPAIPHSRLPALHSLLKHRHDAYQSQVGVCHGTFHNRTGHPTILETLSESRRRETD